MTPSFREIADRCDAFDEEVKAITDARKDFWGEVRDQLPARDVRALKAAIKARKRRRADMEGEEDHDQRTYEILAEIETGTPLAKYSSRTRAPREEDMCGITPYIRGVSVTQKPLPPHDEDGVILDDVTATGPATAAPVQGTASEEAHRGFSDVSSQPIPEASVLPAEANAAIDRITPTVAAPISEVQSPGRSVAHTEGDKSRDDRNRAETALVTAGETAPFPDMPDFLTRKKQMEEAA